MEQPRDNNAEQPGPPEGWEQGASMAWGLGPASYCCDAHDDAVTSGGSHWGPEPGWRTRLPVLNEVIAGLQAGEVGWRPRFPQGIMELPRNPDLFTECQGFCV